MQEVTINPSSFPPRRSPAAGFGLGSRRAARHQYALMIGISNEPLDADIRQINKMFLSFLFFVPPAPFSLFNGTREAAAATHPTQLIELVAAGDVWEKRSVVCVVQENMW